MGSTLNKVIEWGGILLVVFFILPRLLQAFGASNARNAVQYSPAAAWNAQAARAITTAGMAGNTGLAQLLAQLMKPQQQQQPKPGGSPFGGLNGGGANSMPKAPSLDAMTSAIAHQNAVAAGFVGPMSPEWYANRDNPAPVVADWFTNPNSPLSIADTGGGALNFDWTGPGAVEFNPSPSVSSADLSSAWGSSDWSSWNWNDFVVGPADYFPAYDISGQGAGLFDFTQYVEGPSGDSGGGGDFYGDSYDSFDYYSGLDYDVADSEVYA